ncbi:unnamed protein product [Mytilus coruscus]|uniref:Ig-like domain-containing protein n=1 Tax=Mytilus coruscus TaxID=42192 RepID=A0A6J8DXG0_MYTCO|nr:unnamed protein product [Mytilus coruscus]
MTSSFARFESNWSQPVTLDQLEIALPEQWPNILQACIRHLERSMPRPCGDCVAAYVINENDRVDLYATEGEIIILQCQDNAIDHWENLNSRGFVAYCNELKSSLGHFLTEECNLQIRVTIDDYNTTYRCVIGGNPPRVKDFNICMPTPPSKMKILEAKSGKQVLGVEGHQMTLTCNVNSGKPMETIFWTKNGIVVSSGGPGRLQYTFIPKQDDNFQNFTCTANNTLNSIALRDHIQLRLTYRFSPDEINCTSDINITDSFTTTDQMHNGNHQENTSGITRREIILCCALVFMLLLTIILYARNRHYTTRNISIGEQQGDHPPTGTSIAENIHLYSTADDYSVHLFPVSRNGSMQGYDNVLESNSSISSSMDFNVEGDYIHPYDILVYNSQDNNYEYEKLDHSGEYFTSITHDGNEDEKSVTSTDIKCSSITPGSVLIGHVIIVKSSSFNGDKICQKYTMENHGCITNKHVTLKEIMQYIGIAAENQIYFSISDLRTQPVTSGHNTNDNLSYERSGISGQ